MNAGAGSIGASFTGSVTSKRLADLSNLAFPSSLITSNGRSRSNLYLPGARKKRRSSPTSNSAPAMPSIFGVCTRTTSALGRFPLRFSISRDAEEFPKVLERSAPLSR